MQDPPARSLRRTEARVPIALDPSHDGMEFHRMEYYYAVDDLQQGPVSLEELQRLVAEGRVAPTDLGWHQGLGDWMPVASILGIPATAQSPDPSILPGTTTPVAPGESTNPYHVQPAAAGAAMGVPGQVQRTSGLAIASLACGVLAFICFIPISIGGVICGHMALSEIKKSEGYVAGKGLAVAGLVVSYIGVAITVFAVLFLIFAFTSGAMDM